MQSENIQNSNMAVLIFPTENKTLQKRFCRLKSLSNEVKLQKDYTILTWSTYIYIHWAMQLECHTCKITNYKKVFFSKLKWHRVQRSVSA